MLPRLQNAQVKKIREKYADDEFFKMVKVLAPRLETEMPELSMCPEEIFLECQDLLIHIAEQGEDFSVELPSIWDSYYNDFKRENRQVPTDEVKLATSSVLLFTALGLNSSMYNFYALRLPQNILGLLLDNDNHHWPLLNEYVLEGFDDFEDMLRGWFDEVILFGGCNSAKSTNEEKTPKKIFEFKDYAFNYQCADGRNQRLQNFFQALKQAQFIDADSDLREMVDLFSGKRSYIRIKWLKGKESLAYIFKQLINEHKYVQLGGGRIWDTVRSHFVKEDSKPWEDDLRSQKTPADKIKNLCDYIIDILNPAQNKSIRMFEED